MNIKNTIIKHYKKFFDLHAKGIVLDEDDHLNIDWAEDLVKNCFIPNVMQWVVAKEQQPSDETKQYLVLRDGNVEFDTWYHRDGKSYWYNYLGITHWAEIPKPPCA